MSDLGVNIVIALFALAGAYMLWGGLNNMRVLISSCFWPEVPIHVRESRVMVEKSSRWIDAEDAHLTQSVITDVTHHLYGSVATTRSYQPLLRYEYTWNGSALMGSNRMPWNHHMMYNEESSKALFKRAQSPTFRIRVNPVCPRENFLSFGSFPYILTLIFLAAGWALFVGGTSIVIEVLLQTLGRSPLPTWNQRSVSVYVLSALPTLYLVMSIGMNVVRSQQRLNAVSANDSPR